MTEMHKDYFEAKKRIEALANRHPGLRASKYTILLGRKWDDALEKDPSGRQCLHVVSDLEELLTPMAN
jgi:hypothetical protein